MDQPTVATPSLAHKRMAKRWELLHALLGGTQAMRDARHKYLPQEDGESVDAYNARLGRSFLYGAYKDTLKTMAARPFEKEVTVEDGTELVEDLVSDADRAGTSLTQFARQLYWNGLNYGLAHFLVDFPSVNGRPTLGEERKMGLRPYFTQVNPPDLIAARPGRSEGGKMVVEEARIRETRTEPDGEWGEKDVDYVRVVRPTEVQLWRRDTDSQGTDGSWVLTETFANSLGYVPLVTVYFDREGAFEGAPPLEDLAWLNLAHWQSESDQRNILKFSRFAILFVRGKLTTDAKGKVKVGPTNLLHSADKEADAKFVEHTGKAIEAGAKDLQTLEARMETLGLRPFLENIGEQTATARRMDEGSKQSSVQTWIRATETALLEGIRIAHEWQNRDYTEPKLDVYSDFSVVYGVERDIKALMEMRKNREISHATFIRECQRRGVLTGDVDPDEERVELDAETMAELKALAQVEQSGQPEGGGGGDGE